MVRKAKAEDSLQLSYMLEELAVELMPDHAVSDNEVYRNEIFKYMRDDTIHIYIDDGMRGFFMVKDDSEPIYENISRYVGTKVYIKPEARHTRLLKSFYDRLFNDFPDGDIVGLTEIESAHIPVLNKRHEHIANVYKLKRS